MYFALFQLASLAIVGWILLIFLPSWSFSRRLAESAFFPIYLAVLYAFGVGALLMALGPGFIAIYAAEAWWWAARPLWVLILSGVFQRHPELRYVVAENGALLYDPATQSTRDLSPPPPPPLLHELNRRGVPFSAGRSIVATVEPHEHAVLAVISQYGARWRQPTQILEGRLLQFSGQLNF